MFNVTKAFTTDPVLETQGYRHTFPDGGYLLVAREGNPVYQAAMREILAPYTEQLGKMEPEEFDALLVQGLARGILLGWGGISVGSDDVATEYSVATAVTLLTATPDFRKLVESIAKKFANYRAEQVATAKEILGNA